MIFEEAAALRDNEYQHALNDIISNAGTKFNCKHDSFYLMQELVDMYSFKRWDVERLIQSEIVRQSVTDDDICEAIILMDTFRWEIDLEVYPVREDEANHTVSTQVLPETKAIS